MTCFFTSPVAVSWTVMVLNVMGIGVTEVMLLGISDRGTGAMAGNSFPATVTVATPAVVSPDVPVNPLFSRACANISADVPAFIF